MDAKAGAPATTHAREIAAGERFRFGWNWRRFLSVVYERHITQATDSLRAMLPGTDLDGAEFLDVGAGSGKFVRFLLDD